MSFIRLALEQAGMAEAPNTENTLVMRGPLSEMCYQALNVIYAKPDPLSGATDVSNPAAPPALETQALDAHQAQTVLDKLLATDSPGATITIYGVSAAAVTQDTVVDLTNEISSRGDDKGGEFYLVVDATKPGPNSEVVSAPKETLFRLGQESFINGVLHDPAALLSNETPTDTGVSAKVVVPGRVVEMPLEASGDAETPPLEQVAAVVPPEDPEALVAAMETLTRCHGGKVFHSMEAFKAYIVSK